jgi:single-strand DNA-binding protein
MSDINKVIIRGRAAANADWKDLPNTTLVTLRVATSDDYTDRDGRKVERTDWHMVACWGQMADQARGIRKGDVVQVEGKIRTRSYEAKEGKRYITEIIAAKITRDSAEREPQIERDDVPERSDDDIPF